jgi:hypothetical protein
MEDYRPHFHVTGLFSRGIMHSVYGATWSFSSMAAVKVQTVELVQTNNININFNSLKQH